MSSKSDTPRRWRVRISKMICRGSPSLQVGVDTIPERRIREVMQRHGPAFATTIFREAELVAQEAPQGGVCPECNFAVKEALLKALGTGLISGLSLVDLEVIGAGDRVVLHGTLRALAERLRVRVRACRMWHRGGHHVSLVWLDRDGQREGDESCGI
jgi:phosphopantetheinyl transferase (holo-ACP synthase)